MPDKVRDKVRDKDEEALFLCPLALQSTRDSGCATVRTHDRLCCVPMRMYQQWRQGAKERREERMMTHGRILRLAMDISEVGWDTPVNLCHAVSCAALASPNGVTVYAR